MGHPRCGMRSPRTGPEKRHYQSSMMESMAYKAHTQLPHPYPHRYHPRSPRAKTQGTCSARPPSPYMATGGGHHRSPLHTPPPCRQ